MNTWHLVMTEPRKEALVMSQLPRDRFEVYRPVLLASRKLNGKGAVGWVPRPMLPGYLFVRKLFTTSGPITGKIGVSFVFRDPLRQEVIDEVRAEEEDGYIRLIPKEKPVKPSHEEIVKAPVIKDLSGLVQLLKSEPDDQKRGEILFTAMERRPKFLVSDNSASDTAQP